MDIDEDVDQCCVNCGEPCCYDIAGSDDHAYMRDKCVGVVRCSGSSGSNRMRMRMTAWTRMGKTDVVCATIVE